MNLIAIRNDSLQGLEVYFRGPNGIKSHYMQPQSTKVVPKSFLTEQIKKLQRRRMLTVYNYN